MIITLIILFIINNIYFLKNRYYLQKKFSEKNTSNNRLLEVLYYYVNLSYYIFILLGLFTNDNLYFYILSILFLLKFPIYHVSKKVYVIFSYLYPYIKIGILLSLLYTKLF
jgi:hypothetical protein